jgi:hypothetical protein
MREYAGEKIGSERDAVFANRPRGFESKAERFFDRIENGEELTAYGVSFETPGLEKLKQDRDELEINGVKITKKT